MSVELSILSIADTCQQHKATADALVHGSDYRVFMAAHDAEATDVLKDAHVDLILADVENRDCDIVQFLARLRFTHPDLVRVLLVGEEANIKLSDALARTAAYQYLTKPLQAEQTCLVVKLALETRANSRGAIVISSAKLKIGEDFGFSAWQAGYPDEGRSLAFRTPPARQCPNSAVSPARRRAPICRSSLRGKPGPAKNCSRVPCISIRAVRRAP